MEGTIRLADFEQLGMARLFPGNGNGFGRCFAIRIRGFESRASLDADGDPSTGDGSDEAEIAVPHPAGGFVVGFSAVCTHMGCSLARSESDHNIHYDNHQATCGPCPCHGTTFDLAKSGLVVLGPATRNLPQLRLAVVSIDGEAHVKPVAWAEIDDPQSVGWPTDITEGS